MCSICSDCKQQCYCPRCPFRKGSIVWPPSKSMCTICGMNDQECKDPICAITEHFMTSAEMFCQTCVELKYVTKFPGKQLGMSCTTHS